jgi:peptidoglycan/xylan/chitin deacetylase (PgdA/CDA1 family)
MDVDVEQFAMQADWMSANGEVAGIDAGLEGFSSGEDHSVYVITFDDGHRSFFTNVFPIMLERQMPFTLYLTTLALDRGQNLHDDPRQPLLTWSEIGEMYESGLVTVGAHGHRHLDVRKHSPSEIADDFERCDESIERRIGENPRHFAYPWGHWSRKADIEARSRYRSAAVGAAGVRMPVDLHRLPRIPIMGSDKGPLFRRKLWGGFRLETVARDLRDRMYS